jgi:hypothetical protein
MSTTTFSDGVTLTAASWFNDVDTATYMTLSGVSGTNTITATGPKNATLSTNLRVVFVPANTNSGATTINITPSGGAALTAKNVFCNGIACVGGEIKQNVPVMLHYDGTQFNILGPFTAGTIPGNVTVSGTLIAGTIGGSTVINTSGAITGGAGSFTTLAASSSVTSTGGGYPGGTASSVVLVGGTNPAIAFSSGNATANTSKWDLYSDNSTQFHGRAIKDDNTGANDWITVTRSGFTISSVAFPNGAVSFAGVGTTASAANAYLDNAASNNLLRSTSSIRYKKDVETLDAKYSSGIYKFRPVWYRSKAQADRKDWGFYGLIAEEVSEIDPRLVHWTHRDTKEVLVSAATEAQPAILDEEGNVTTPAVDAKPAQYQTVIDKDSPLIPDGVQYERISVLLLAEVQKLRAEFDSYKAFHP